MTIEKLKSGHYRLTQMEHGRRYRVTVDRKPTKAEAVRLLAAEIERQPQGGCGATFEQAADAYIRSKDNILSPSTIRGYRSYLRNLDADFRAMKASGITSKDLQVLVNSTALTHSPKFTANIAAFAAAVLRSVDVELRRPQLPRKVRKEPYIPSEDEVRRVMAHFKGTRYEAAIALSALGMRRSEICAVTAADLDGDTLTIDKALVQDDSGNWVTKATKTASSTRTIILPPHVSGLIREQGRAYCGYPNSINEALEEALKKLGIRHFSLHKLRHFFASYMHNLGYSDKQIQEMGGWKTDNVMKSVYQHAMEMDRAKAEMGARIGSLLP